jgi:hypothetical protein
LKSCMVCFLIVREICRPSQCRPWSHWKLEVRAGSWTLGAGSRRVRQPGDTPGQRRVRISR